MGMLVKNLEITDIKDHVYTFKEADLTRHFGEGIHVRGLGADEGVRFEISYDNILTLMYRLDQEDKNEQNT